MTPEQVMAVLASQGHRGHRHQGRRGFIEIRTKDAALAAPAPRPTPVAVACPRAVGARRVRVASASPRGHRRRPRRRLRVARPRPPSPAPSASPSPSGSPAASPGASASPGRRPSSSPAPTIGAGGALPTPGQAGRRSGSPLEAGPSGQIAEQQSLSTVGAVVSSDLITQALILILVRVDRDPALDHLPLPRLPDGRRRADRAAPRRAGRGRHLRDPRDVRRPSRSTACS